MTRLLTLCEVWRVAADGEMFVIVKRKARGLVCASIGAQGTGPEAYPLEVQGRVDRRDQVLFLDLKQAKDFYRMPVGVPIRLTGGRVPGRVGWWVHSWERDTPS